MLVLGILRLATIGQGWQPGFENPGHAGHMCPATFEISQPQLDRPKAQQN